MSEAEKIAAKAGNLHRPSDLNAVNGLQLFGWQGRLKLNLPRLEYGQRHRQDDVPAVDVDFAIGTLSSNGDLRGGKTAGGIE